MRRSAGAHGALPGNEEPTESLRVMIKGRAGIGDVPVGVCYRPPNQEDQVDEQHHIQKPWFSWELQTPQYLLDRQHIRAQAIQEARECTDGILFLQLTEEPMRRVALPDKELLGKL